MQKKVIVSVTNDLVTDQRVDRTCQTLIQLGFHVVLVGRYLRNGIALGGRTYACHRMHLLFRKGPLFYAEFNIRLFLLLLIRKSHLLVSNDLDTLPANYLIHKIKGIPVVFDSHEYFTGVPELQNRPIPRKTWKAIERWIFPKLEHTITVNDSIASLFEQEYGHRPRVVRNLPERIETPVIIDRSILRLPQGRPLLLMQGSGINVRRGAEEAVMAMQYLPDTNLLIIGGGDVMPRLHELVTRLDLEDQVYFLPRMPHTELVKFTAAADIGLSLDKGDNINYRFSLPNKLFDYIQARIPVLGSDLPEVRRIIETYEIGEISENHDPAHIAHKIKTMLSDPEKTAFWKEKLNIAASELCWENEAPVLRDVFRPFI
ncbi:MAG TPA: glycosyltransferase [Bacteroidales bacterium]|nr:glycosyltransferase [Bacteroidales bacterium]